LSGLEPVYGLYTSFFGVIFYAIFGTSRFVSIGEFSVKVFKLSFLGSFAVVALMTGVSVREIYQRIDDEYVHAEIRFYDETKMAIDPRNYTEMVPKTNVAHAELVQIITFTSGLVHLLLGVSRVEFLASYLSDQLVNGFCTGAAVHVVVVQLGKLFEIPVQKFSGPGYLLRVKF
jgi:MFS superfamily sulfate permease-like transporter